MLKADHQRVRDLFQHYAHSRDPHLRQQIAAQVFVALELHALLEETVFYPAVAGATDPQGEALVEDAREEHQRVRERIAHLRACDPEDVKFDPCFHDLMDYVCEHIQDEERAMLPKAEEQLGAKMRHLHAEMRDLKQDTTGA